MVVAIAAQMSGVLAAHRVGEGAAVGLCLDENGHMFLGVNSSQARGVLPCCQLRSIRARFHTSLMLPGHSRCSTAWCCLQRCAIDVPLLATA